MHRIRQPFPGRKCPYFSRIRPFACRILRPGYKGQSVQEQQCPSERREKKKTTISLFIIKFQQQPSKSELQLEKELFLYWKNSSSSIDTTRLHVLIRFGFEGRLQIHAQDTESYDTLSSLSTGPHTSIINRSEFFDLTVFPHIIPWSSEMCHSRGSVQKLKMKLKIDTGIKQFVISHVCMVKMEDPFQPFVLTCQHHPASLHFSTMVLSLLAMVDMRSKNIVF